MMTKPFLIRASAVLALAAALGVSLGGCVALAVGGAATTALVVTDRRTSGAQLEDQGIEIRAGNRIRDELGSRVHINLTSYNRQVLLTGEVPSAEDRAAAEAIVAKVDNVRAIVNELGVMPASSLRQRSSDVVVTGKVKAALLDTDGLLANTFKVVTERDVVYLMGRVTQREADRATEVVRNISGVARVVRVLEIISEDELRRYTAK